MGSPQDIALGRLLQERGFDPGALRQVYATLPPQQSLAGALVQRGMLSEEAARGLLAELAGAHAGTMHLPPGAGAPQAGSVHLPPGAHAGTVHLPPGAHAGTVHLPPGAQAGTVHLPPGGQVGTVHLPPGAAHPPPSDGQATYIAPPPSDGQATYVAPPPGSAVHAPPSDGQATYIAPPPGMGSAGGYPSATHATVAGGAPAPLAASGEGALPNEGEVLNGRYRVIKVLGQGGMGAVYRATDLKRGDLEVALKVMLPGAAGDDALTRFQREAEALAKVDDHAGIVRVTDYGRARGMPYCALDLVEGGDLHDRVKEEGGLPADEVIRVTEIVARAIHHCHERSILHRDLKPANILVRASDGAPFVTDFGLAYDSAEEGDRLTQTGQVMGTPAYMPPEQAEGDLSQIDARSDVYGLGAILYELLAGGAPFRGEGYEIIKQVLLDEPEDLAAKRPEIPRDLVRIQQKAMAKDPKLRYATAAALADDLARLQRGEPISARPPTRKERQAWRRKQGDKVAWAELIAVRVVLPLALVAGLGLLSFKLRPLERFALSKALAEPDPAAPETPEDSNPSGWVRSVLGSDLIYPSDTDAADVLRRRATLLAESLITIYGVEADATNPAEALRLVAVSGELSAEDAGVIAALARRVDVASGHPPRSKGPIPAEVDAYSATFEILAKAGYGTEEGVLPKKAGDSQARALLKVLVDLAKALEDYEEEGLKTLAAREGTPAADAWPAQARDEIAGEALKPYGGIQCWRGLVRTLIQERRGLAAGNKLPPVSRRLLSDTKLVLNAYHQTLEHFKTEPATDTTALHDSLVDLGLVALVRLTKNHGLFKDFAESYLGPRIDWRKVLAKSDPEERAGLQIELTKALLSGRTTNELVPASHLVLAMRLRTPPQMLIKMQPKAYVPRLRAHVEKDRKRGKVLAEAYYLLAETESLVAGETDVDRANPELVLRQAVNYGSALGSENLPCDVSVYAGFEVEEPYNLLERREHIHAQARVLHLLLDYEHYIRSNDVGRAPQHKERRLATLERALEWFYANSKELRLGERLRLLRRMGARVIEFREELGAERHHEISMRMAKTIEGSLDVVLRIAEQRREDVKAATAITDLNESLDARLLERSLANLLDLFCNLVQKVDYPRVSALAAKVHERFQTAKGRPSPRLFKAQIHITLGNEKLDEAEPVARRFVEAMHQLEPRAKEGLYDELGEDLSDLRDMAEAWLSQTLALKGELKEARAVRQAAIDKGGHFVKEWAKADALLKE